ncbi:hypothetical protein BI347_18655 [Chromobacterium sphagni]|uniref:Glycosyltransferase RgtA/B/C/D-like domain-containing protein n=1 Tax=Chromobacterium sphagni TaxID=1903179 RepID=A0A1S1WX90_9NEIS|nr:hypothetical protein [Chromobacterium sphagni]OHX11665.1 hypothetical protein BI347_18655 [Chromobacterium sphagni]
MKLKAIRLHLPISHWLAIFLTAAALFLSFDLGNKQPEYRLRVEPTPGQIGHIHLVFYGSNFRSGDLTIPASGWSITHRQDSTVLAAEGAVEPVEIRAHSIPLAFGLLHFPAAGSVTLSGAAGYLQKIDLKSSTETVTMLTLGGPTSPVPSSGDVTLYSTGTQVAIALAVLALLTAIAWRMNHHYSQQTRAPKRMEIIYLALPFLLTTSLTLLAYIPGNASYDGSLQWTQAANRGELLPALGFPATYLMRLFTLVSSSPLPMLVLQSAAAALGTGMVLHQLRHRGVPFIIAMGAAIILAATPQYFAFFTGLGKDPLSLIGALFFTWALLAIFRRPKASPGMLGALAFSAVFSGLMRTNAMPVVMLVLVTTLALLFWRQKNRWAIAIGSIAIAVALITPKILTSLAVQEISEHQDTQHHAPTYTLPLGMFANWYIFHLFNAAIASEVNVPEKQAEPFFTLMPKDKWKKFSCHMTDDIIGTIFSNMEFTQTEYLKHLHQHQTTMAMTVLRLAYEHPDFALKRQACITEMLWHTGVDQKPFQTTATLGYDGVDKRFIDLAGESRTKWPALRLKIQNYQLWSEQENHFWLFWKPALPFILGIFIVGLYLVNHRDTGAALAFLLPLLSIAILAVVIPFPAYRYAYPGVLLMQLLSVLLFARPLHPSIRATQASHGCRD